MKTESEKTMGFIVGNTDNEPTLDELEMAHRAGYLASSILGRLYDNPYNRTNKWGKVMSDSWIHGFNDQKKGY